MTEERSNWSRWMAPSKWNLVAPVAVPACVQVFAKPVRLAVTVLRRLGILVLHWALSASTLLREGSCPLG
jgi:hypothetical protein